MSGILPNVFQRVTLERVRDAVFASGSLWATLVALAYGAACVLALRPIAQGPIASRHVGGVAALYGCAIVGSWFELRGQPLTYVLFVCALVATFAWTVGHDRTLRRESRAARAAIGVSVLLVGAYVLHSVRRAAGIQVYSEAIR
jgi:hypothetical protein